MTETETHIWTGFSDNSSGGYRKCDYKFVFIQAPESEALDIFQTELDVSPFGSACKCCGPNFSFWGITDEDFEGYLPYLKPWEVRIIDSVELAASDYSPVR